MHHWLRMGGLYGALSTAVGDDLLITLRSGAWHVRRITPADRDDTDIQEANDIAVTSALSFILSQSAPPSLRDVAQAVYAQRGWGGCPPDELAELIERDERLALTPLNGVVPGPGTTGEDARAWNRARLRAGTDALKEAPAEDLEAALSILGLSGAAADGLRATQRLVRGQPQDDAEAMAAQILRALMSDTKPS